MAIQLTCGCGKRLQVADDQAGRKVRCPACKELVPVPDEAGGDDGMPYAMASYRKCPVCKHEWPGDAVVCVDCGYNFKTGQRMQTVYRVLERTVDVGATWLGSYTRLVFARDRKGHATLTISKRFLFIPTGTREIDLSEYSAVLVDCALGHQGGEESSPDVYYLDLEGPRQRPLRILSTTDEWKMREVVDTLKEAARLEIKRR
jgi:hypothetical protein